VSGKEAPLTKDGGDYALRSAATITTAAAAAANRSRQITSLLLLLLLASSMELVQTKVPEQQSTLMRSEAITARNYGQKIPMYSQ